MAHRQAALLGAGPTGGLLVALSLAACGGATEQAGPSPADAGVATGSVNAEFRLPSGTASSASYTLTGPGGVAETDMLDFQGSQIIGFELTLPAGAGYTLAFTATDGDGGQSCTGSASFDVTADKTSMVNVVATCSGGPFVPTGYGAVDTWVSLPPGTSLADAECDLVGPGGVEAHDTLTVSGTSGLHFSLKNVPAGNGQVIGVTAHSTSGQKCVATTAVDVVVSQTAEAMLALQCTP